MKPVPKIVRSPDLGIWATHKYNEPVKSGEKLASLCFESFGKVHERHKYCVFVGHAYQLQKLLSAHAHMYNSAKYQIFVAQYFREFRDLTSDHENLVCSWWAWLRAVQRSELRAMVDIASTNTYVHVPVTFFHSKRIAKVRSLPYVSLLLRRASTQIESL